MLRDLKGELAKEAKQAKETARKQAQAAARAAEVERKLAAEADFERRKRDGASARTLPKRGDLKHYSNEDRVAFQQAFAGVDSLGGAKKNKRRAPDRTEVASRVRRRAEEAEEEARARLGRLVGGGVKFVVSREGPYVEGRRRDTPARTCELLANGELAPKAHLDLHGKTKQEAKREVRRFVRASHAAGRKQLSIIHGKGLHSEGGQGVLRDAVVSALTTGGAAPLVDAFATAPRTHGGDGAILVRLRAAVT